MDFAQAATMGNAADRDMTIIQGCCTCRTKFHSARTRSADPLQQSGRNGERRQRRRDQFRQPPRNPVSLGALTQNGEVGVAQTMAELTNAILNAHEIAEGEKSELLEHVAFLTSQASAPPADRKPGMTVVSAVKDGAAAVGSVAGAWAAVEPLLQGHFGL